MAYPTVNRLDVGLAILGVLIFTRLVVKVWSKATSLPPGPKKLPVIGNLFDMPSEREWETFAKWGEKWGDVTSVTIFGQSVIILNSVELAFDMLDKKSAIYSDRPVFQMGGELVGWKNTLILVPYSDRFRSYRKLFHQLIGTRSSMSRFLPIEEAETHRFLQRVSKDPDNLSAHVRHTSGAIILRISHGYKVQEKNDPFIQLADIATEQFSSATAPGSFIVDLLPILRYVPEWFPGAGFQKKAKVWAKTLSEMVDEPHRFTKEQIAAGTAETSFTSSLLEGKEVSATEDFDIKWSAASLYSGGADTTVSSNYSFFRAIALYPEVQKKAQAEIDAVVGNDRLPGFADRSQLPYVDALCKEVLRYHAVAPIGAPHRVMEDNIQEGYLIPKGSIVIPNAWKMLHDPRDYENPMTFNPERFLASPDKAPERDPRDICFGFGRRICPGRVLADASVFITCAMALAVFDISPPVVNGILVKPVEDQTSGTISHPRPFKCTIQPRSDKALSLIRGEIQE